MTINFKFDIDSRIKILPLANLVGTICSASWDGLKNEYLVVYWMDGNKKREWVQERDLINAETSNN